MDSWEHLLSGKQSVHRLDGGKLPQNKKEKPITTLFKSTFFSGHFQGTVVQGWTLHEKGSHKLLVCVLIWSIDWFAWCMYTDKHTWNLQLSSFFFCIYWHQEWQPGCFLIYIYIYISNFQPDLSYYESTRENQTVLGRSCHFCVNIRDLFRDIPFFSCVDQVDKEASADKKY